MDKQSEKIHIIESRGTGKPTLDEVRANPEKYQSEIAEIMQSTCETLTASMQPTLEQLGQQLEQPIKSFLEYVHSEIAPLVASLTKSIERHINKLRHTPSEFKDNPEACERFRVWFADSGLTAKYLGERVWRVSHTTYLRYVKDPSCMSALAAMLLEDFIGTEKYTDMLYGEGAYRRGVDTQMKKQAIERLAPRLKSLTLEQLSQVDAFVSAIAGGESDVSRRQ